MAEPSKGFIRNIINLIEKTFRKALHYRAFRKNENITKALNKAFIIEQFAKVNLAFSYMDEYSVLLEFKNAIKHFTGKNGLIEETSKSNYDLLYGEKQELEKNMQAVNEI